MTKAEAQKLSKRIVNDADTVEIAGFRHYGRGSYEIDCRDRVSGGTFVVRSTDDWQARFES